MMAKKYPMAFVTEPGKIGFQEKDLIDPSEKEILIKGKFSSICGSDLHLFRGKHPSVQLPSAVGHELSGEIAAVGEEVTHLKKGDRVTVEPVLSCGNCDFCRRGQYHLCENISFQYRKGQGSFAPYFTAPMERVFKLPDSLSYEEGALIEPLSVALHAVKKSGIGLGRSCAVFGAGAIGLLVTMLVNRTANGNCFVVDINNFRLKKALDLGATRAINNQSENAVDAILNETGQQGVDYSFEAVGMELTLTQALQVVRKGGLATLLGIFEKPLPKLPVNLFIQREITLSGSQGYNWDFQDAINILEQGDLDLKPLITHKFPLSDIQKGFDLLMERGNKAVKILIDL